MKLRIAQIILLVLLGGLLLGLTGCSTEDPANNSARPWNSPQGWENGLPMMNQQGH